MVKYSSSFTGKEFFFTDHIIRGRTVLSGASYLEMARAAVEAACGNAAAGGTLRLKDVSWGAPVAGETPAKITIGVTPDENGVFYEVNSTGEDGETAVHSRGRAEFVHKVDVKAINIQEIENQEWRKKFSTEDFYSALKQLGRDSGPAFRGMESLWLEEENGLAKISIPASVSGKTEEFRLHPSIIDPVFQAVLLFQDRIDGTVPGHIDEMDILGGCVPSMRAVFSVREAAGKKKFDIDFCDDAGNIRIRIKGLELKKEEAPLNPVALNEEPFQTMTFEEVWEEKASSGNAVHDKTVVCFVSDNQTAVSEAVKTGGKDNQLIFIREGKAYKKLSAQEYMFNKEDPASCRKAFESILESGVIDAVVCFQALEDPKLVRDYSWIINILQQSVSAGLKSGRFILAADSGEGLEFCYAESWIGFERSLGMVLPQIRLTGFFTETGTPGVLERMDMIMEELQEPEAVSVLYREGKRLVRRIKPAELEPGKDMIRNGGTYLITGGLGGLGFLFAERLASEKKANLVITGRSKLDDEKKDKIKAIEAAGGRAIYYQADVCDSGRMKEIYTEAKGRFGGIHGIIHAAGLPASGSVLEKGAGDFQKVIGPKVEGTIVLDRITEGEELDFICYFSSSSAILGDFGSCDYAVGCRFQMSYAEYRDRLFKKGQVKGRTVVINWPLWKEGGMGFESGELTEMYLKSSGQRFLETREGIELFEKLLPQEKIQHLIVSGQKSRVYRFLGLSEGKKSKINIKASVSSGKGRKPAMKGLSAEECVEWDLKELIGQLLMIPREKINGVYTLVDFGFDSISLATFASALSMHYGIELTPAVFFSYPTIKKLSAYFLKDYPEMINGFYLEDSAGFEENIAHQTELTAEKLKHKEIRTGMKKVFRDNREPIAVIGISGRFPESRNAGEMWKFLAEGREAIRPLPLNRTDSASGDSKWKCGLVPGVDEFEPLFFEISPREAKGMDPRQRLLLQESWNALEDAGYGPDKVKRDRFGMFVGAEQGTYQLIAGQDASVTSNHDGVLAARLAYFLNFSGPVLSINTACSSGLVAVHEACMSLRNAECDAAIAAGVNLMLMPEMFESMNQAGMLSEDGRCYAFDKRANGLVAGEAVVAVVLKKLSRAERDGDPVYAVIKGSGINYDGKTNGITAPNGAAQTELLKTVYEKNGINPGEIEYIITHGTGTKLGDPVEVNALNDVFKTAGKGFCALTSAKTNFGHTFAASGMVNLVALIQSFKNRNIPASLNFEHENEYIHWKDSPFYVNKSNKEWLDKEGKKRMGAVSAFGMSGTNVHMVLESYPEDAVKDNSEEKPCYLLALSARTPDSLRDKIVDMISTLKAKDWSGKDLNRLSYTLIEGRQHFDHRLAVVFRDSGEAAGALIKAVKNEKQPNVFQGKVTREFTRQKAIEKYARDLACQIQTGNIDLKDYQDKLHALADLYCQGYSISAGSENSEIRIRRLNLPAYPFAREKHWAEKKSVLQNSAAPVRQLHPLLHENRSNFMEQRFYSVFSGGEFFLSDHKIKDRTFLPAAAYIEMTRAAVQAAAGISDDENANIRLKSMEWTMPAAIGEKPIRMNIGLEPETNGDILYEIVSENSGGDFAVLNRGEAEIIEVIGQEKIDLVSLQGRKWKRTLSSGECYRIFQEMGIEYGPGYQALDGLFIDGEMVLANLKAPTALMESFEQYYLHPSMIDAALQALLGMNGGSLLFNPSLPVRIESIEVFHPCKPVMWAVIRLSDQRDGLNIEIYDDHGLICTRLNGLAYQEEQKGAVKPPAVQVREIQGEAVPEETVLEFLSKSLAETLYVEDNDIDPDKKFIDMGLDSIIAVEWIKTVNKQFNMAVIATKVYDYPTVRDFAAFICEELNKTERIPDNNPLPMAEPVSTAGLPVTQPRKTLSVAVSEETVLEFLSESLAATLYIEQNDIDPDKKFIDMGLDSIIAVEWIKTVNKQFGTVVIATRVYDYPTVRDFAAFICEELDKAGKIPEIPSAAAVRPALEPVKPAVELSSGVQAAPARTRDKPSNVTLGFSVSVQPIAKTKPVVALIPEKEAGVKAAAAEVLKNPVADKLAESLANTLFIKKSDVGLDEDMKNLGLDEILSEEWIRKVNKEFGSAVEVKALLEYPSVRKFSGYLENELKRKDGKVNLKPKETVASNPVPSLEPAGVPLKPVLELQTISSKAEVN